MGLAASRYAPAPPRPPVCFHRRDLLNASGSRKSLHQPGSRRPHASNHLAASVRPLAVLRRCMPTRSQDRRSATAEVKGQKQRPAGLNGAGEANYWLQPPQLEAPQTVSLVLANIKLASPPPRWWCWWWWEGLMEDRDVSNHSSR